MWEYGILMSGIDDVWKFTSAAGVNRQHDNQIIELLNRIGFDGWEAVGIWSKANGGVLMKRRISEAKNER